MPSVFLELAKKVIEEEKRPLTPTEIWEIAQSKDYDKELLTKGKTPAATLGARLYVEVRDNLTSEFITTGTRPKKFILRSLNNSIYNDSLETPTTTIEKKYLEKDLHPVLVYYGFYYLNAYLKTIQHQKSNKKVFSEWLHPDIVGCYFPFGDWEDEVVEVSSLIGSSAIKLYSFELKRELSFANLREAFFQAVSNSSWANEGYLVAAKVDSDNDFQLELERLSTSFGIGVIRLDIEDPDSSKVILPAKSRDLVDWETVNKLASINKDFSEFLKRVKKDIDCREIRREMYDPVLEKEELIKIPGQL
ncbi:MAG: hypothetical protein HEQ24_20770 [Dolichospermum sp. BR01]|jgi:uncharacterized protein|nr:hypothetical protein [Dolichospermum sp. BR01]